MNNLAREIANEIRIASMFDEYNIKGLLNLLMKTKPEYKQYKFLGVGSNSLVLETDQQTAIKVIKVNSYNIQYIDKLQQQIQYLKQLQYSQYILQVYNDYFLFEGQPANNKSKQFYVIETELCRRNLQEYLHSLKLNHLDISEEQKDRLAIQLLDALHFLHQKGICHGDIKPQNILYQYLDDGSIALKLSDIGYSKMTSNIILYKDNCQNRLSKGTESYMPYEVLNNKYYFESDLFSLGLVLLQIDNHLSFDFLSLLPIELQDVQREINDQPFQNHLSIKRSTVIYTIARQFLKKNIRERKSAQESLSMLLEKQKQKNQNAYLQIYSRFNENKVQDLISLIPWYKEKGEVICSNIISMHTYDQFEILAISQSSLVIGAVNLKQQNRKVVLKIQDYNIQQQSITYQTILDQMNVIKDVNMPYILKVYDSLIIQDSIKMISFIVTERCDFSLQSYLEYQKYNKDLTEQMKIDIAIQMIDALNYLHSKQVIHKNIKPHNFLISITPESNIVQVKLVGYKAILQSSQIKQAVKKSEENYYSAPEVSDSQQHTIQSDIFSIGIVLIQLDNYETFEYPTKSSFEQILSQFQMPFQQVQGINRKSILYEIAEQCLRYDPNQRNSLNDILNKLKLYNISSLKIYTQVQIIQMMPSQPNNQQKRVWNIDYNKLIQGLKGNYDLVERIKERLESQKELYLNTSKICLNLQKSFLKKVFQYFSSPDDLNEQGAEALGMMLNTCNQVQDLEINLESVQITQNGLIKLLEEMSSCVSINKIKLNIPTMQVKCIDPQPIEQLILTSQHNISNIYIDVNDNTISKDHLNIFIQSVSTLKYLDTFMLKGKITISQQIGDSLLSLLSHQNQNFKLNIQITHQIVSLKAFKHPDFNPNINRLQQLGIKLIGDIGIEGTRIFIKGLQQCLSLTQLNLNLTNTDLNVQGYQYLGYALSQLMNLQELSLEIHSTAGDQQLISFSDQFQPCSNLQMISLNLGNNITEKGFSAFTESLWKYTMVKTINFDFQENRIYGSGIFAAFGERLKQLTQLANFTLSLKMNSIGDKEITNLASSISQLPQNLKTLKIDLSNNNISDKGATNFVERIQYLPICILDISFNNNYITDEGATKVIQHLKKIPLSHLRIKMKSNKITNKGAIMIADCLINTKPVEFFIHLDQNKIDYDIQQIIIKKQKDVSFTF